MTFMPSRTAEETEVVGPSVNDTAAVEIALQDPNAALTASTRLREPAILVPVAGFTLQTIGNAESAHFSSARPDEVKSRLGT